MTMTKGRKIALGLSLTVATLAGAAYAEQGMKGDGVTTRAEAQERAQEMFARMDANKDGKLDQADRAARRAAMFDRIDTDHNGQISRAEFDAMGSGGRGGPDGMRGHDAEGGPGMHRWGGHGRGGHRGGMMMGRMADANKDGTITQAEFVSAAMQRFDRADANHDGTVTREERQAARKAMHDEMRARWQNAPDGAPGAPPAPAN
jgi:Ca2+-binding EF-hand superfamily protein